MPPASHFQQRRVSIPSLRVWGYENIQENFRRSHDIKMFRIVICLSLMYHHDKGNAGSGLLRTNLENDEEHSVNKTACN
jgi:hypothetical protein